MAEVRVLRPSDAAVAARVLARGFEQEPAKVALAPDPSARQAVLELSAHNRLYDALRRGTAHAALEPMNPPPLPSGSHPASHRYRSREGCAPQPVRSRE